ncbi:MAG: hypothetical protein ACTMIY_11985 [Microbacterium gubbeenense]
MSDEFLIRFNGVAYPVSFDVTSDFLREILAYDGSRPVVFELETTAAPVQLVWTPGVAVTFEPATYVA